MRSRRAGDRGGVTSFVAIVAVALVMVAGMVYDGGQVLAAHASARAAAAKAARAGAQEIDIALLRESGEVALQPAGAEAAALAYLDEAGAVGTATVEGNTVTVSVTIVQPMLILPLPDRTVVATEEASAVEVLPGGIGDGTAAP